ncbi:MAG: MATE family efflux transporter [Bacteroidota bacterium]
MQSPFVIYKTQISETLKLAYPIILGQLGIILMGVADTLMVGPLGSEVLASANQANNLFFMVSGLTFGVLFSISTLVSIKVGQKRAADGFITYRAGLVVALVLFVFQYLVLQVFVYNFHWLGQDEAVTRLAPGLLNILSWSILPLLINVVTRQFTDGLGYTKIAMLITLGGLGLNVLLCWVFIYGHWGFDAMGLNGAGYATLVSRTAMALVGLWYVRYSAFMRKYVPSVMPKWDKISEEMPSIWKLGLPVALQTFAEWACFGLSGVMVGWYGSKQLAAHAVALNVASVTYMVVSGIAMAGAIIVGNNYGEKNRHQIRHAAHAVFLIIGVFEVINAVAFVFGNQAIASLYDVKPEVMPTILPLFILAAVFQLADGIQAGAMNMLRGIKDVNWSSGLSILSYWVISLPLSYALGVWQNWQVYGIWIGFTVGLFVAAGLGVWRFYSHLRVLTFEVESSFS